MDITREARHKMQVPNKGFLTLNRFFRPRETALSPIIIYQINADMMIRSIRFLLLAIFVLCVDCRKHDYNSAHPHQGILKPYHPGPFDNIQLAKKDEAHLLEGKPVMKQVIPDNPDESGTVLCIQDVNAPKPAVWNQILGLDAYEGKVPKVKECHNYVVRKNADGSHSIKTFMKLGIMPGYSYTNHYDHTYVPEKDSMVWSLDYEKFSDFDDVAGHWHLEDHPTKPVRSPFVGGE